MKKIVMSNPVVEIDGDEMTRILWSIIKEELLLPNVELLTEYYDLGLKKRDETDDQITLDAANAIKKWHVGVKCATITPNASRMQEYNLKKMYKSPNGTIRSVLDGTVFRTPILIPGVEPNVRTWKQPITIARHAYGDLYKATEMRVPGKGSAELVFTDENGNKSIAPIYEFECPGVLQGMYNKDSSITSFAVSCFEYALATKQDLWFASKDTISKTYDGVFRDTFQSLFEKKYKQKFDDLGIKYVYTLIDDAVARVIRSDGGYIWACKNYDGDVMSDMISAAFGSMAMMRSVLVSPDGNFEYEAAHGTITRHYYRYLNGETPSSNPIATIFAWTGALRKRGELDENESLVRFCCNLETACINTIKDGIMTKDLAAIIGNITPVTSSEYIAAVKERI